MWPSYIAFGAPLPPKEILQKTRLVEINDGDIVNQRIKELKNINSKLVVAVRVDAGLQGY